MSNAEIQRPTSVAVIGGTFDPIHYAHLLIAEDVRRRFGLTQVCFMPAGAPPHKPGERISPAEDRYIMALLATAGDPHFTVSRLEIDRPGPSYSIDTIRRLRAEAGEDGRVYWVIGADAALELLTWRQPDAILAEATVVVAPRPGFDLGRLEETLGTERASKLTVIEAPLANISSTMIRAMVRAGESIRYLTPPAVVDYISKRGLYRVPAGASPEGPPPS